MKRLLPALLLLVGGAVPALALEGRVQDPAGRPVEKARVCIVLPGGANGLCSETDAEGFYQLPDTSQPTMRVVADGYLILERPMVPHDEPLRLEPAATLWVRLENKDTGQPIDHGEVRLVTSAGRSRGPFPVNAAGVRVHTLPPGLVKISGSAEGYRPFRGRRAQLVGGRETEVVLGLDPRPPEKQRAPDEQP